MSNEPAGSSHSLVVAEFGDPAAARQAMLELEGIGVDGQAINLVTPSASVPAHDIERSGELAAAGDTAKRYAGGAVVGAIIGAVIGAAIGLFADIGPQSISLIGGGLAGAIAGFLLGGFWGAASRLPANPDALDTYTTDGADGAPVRLEVRAHSDEQARRTVEVLQHARARSVAREA
jgi:hypothetical protein